jgi:hypothetical protein
VDADNPSEVRVTAQRRLPSPIAVTKTVQIGRLAADSFYFIADPETIWQVPMNGPISSPVLRGVLYPGGGDIDYWKASYWKDFIEVTVRSYDPKTGLWRLY